MEKSIKFLKEEVSKLRGYAVIIDGEGGEWEPVTTVSVEDIYELINQLDKLEVLSQEFINEKVVEIYADTADAEVHAVFRMRDLQNLLVPKQELPVIPQFVADYISRRKKSGKGLDGAFTYIKAYGWDDESSCDYKVYKWLSIGSNAEIFARAWLDGFTIEEEQKYRVIDSHKVYLLAKEEERNKVETVAKLVEFYGHEHVELNYQLTEQEIKDYDERYFAFAKPVEELE